jgi:hypothetical protein
MKQFANRINGLHISIKDLARAVEPVWNLVYPQFFARLAPFFELPCPSLSLGEITRGD